MSQNMIVQAASFKGKQVVRAPIARPARHGKTVKDKASGAWSRRPSNIRDRQDRRNELK